MVNLKSEYKKWCSETKRNGAIITGKSLFEFFDHVQDIINEASVKESSSSYMKGIKDTYKRIHTEDEDFT